MNARRFPTAFRLTTALALLTATATAGAADPAAADPALDPVFVRSSLTIECSAPRVPGFAEIGRILEVDNAGQAYALRSRVRLEINRACLRGFDRVVVTRAPEGGRPTPRLVAQQD